MLCSFELVLFLCQVEAPRGLAIDNGRSGSGGAPSSDQMG